jgi:hypothetical protein
VAQGVKYNVLAQSRKFFRAFKRLAPLLRPEQGRFDWPLDQLSLSNASLRFVSAFSVAIASERIPSERAPKKEPRNSAGFIQMTDATNGVGR